MNPSRWLAVGVLMGAVLVVGLWSMLGPDVRQLETSRDSLDAAVTALREAAGRQAAVDRAREDSIARLTGQVAQQAAQARIARQGARETGRALDSAVAGNAGLAALVEQQRASYEAVIAADSSTIAALTRVVALRTSQLTARDSLLGQLTTALTEATAQRDQWRRVAKGPRWYVRAATMAGQALAVAATCRLIPGEAQPC